MRKMAVSMLRILVTLGVCFLPSTLIGQGSPVILPAATSLASRYLQDLDRTESLPSLDGRKDFVFVGHSRDRYGAWRVIVVVGTAKPRVAWDSFSLRDSYFYAMGSSSIDTESDGADGYTVTLRGCAPHQCYDGRIGFALYSSKNHRVYISHVTTRDDDSYKVTYYPKAGIPETYRSQLDRMICADSGISRRAALPLKCAAQ